MSGKKSLVNFFSPQNFFQKILRPPPPRRGPCCSRAVAPTAAAAANFFEKFRKIFKKNLVGQTPGANIMKRRLPGFIPVAICKLLVRFYVPFASPFPASLCALVWPFALPSGSIQSGLDIQTTTGAKNCSTTLFSKPCGEKKVLK